MYNLYIHTHEFIYFFACWDYSFVYLFVKLQRSVHVCVYVYVSDIHRFLYKHIHTGMHSYLYHHIYRYKARPTESS